MSRWVMGGAISSLAKDVRDAGRVSAIQSSMGSIASTQGDWRGRARKMQVVWKGQPCEMTWCFFYAHKNHQMTWNHYRFRGVKNHQMTNSEPEDLERKARPKSSTETEIAYIRIWDDMVGYDMTTAFGIRSQTPLHEMSLFRTGVPAVTENPEFGVPI